MSDITDRDAQNHTAPMVDANQLLALWASWLQADVADIITENGAFKPIKDWPPVWRQLVVSIEAREQFERTKDGGDASDRTGSQILKVKWISAKESGTCQNGLRGSPNTTEM